MNRKVAFVVFLVFVVVVISVVAVVYANNKDKTSESEIPEFANLTVYVKVQDDISGEDLVTDFLIFSDGVVVGEGRTVLGAFEEVLVKKKIGASLFMLNVNRDDYYGNKLHITNNRASLDAYRVGVPELSFVSKTDSLIFLNLSIRDTGYQLRKIGFCVDHGFSYVSVKDMNPSHKIINPPSRLEGFGVACYNTFFTLAVDNPSLEIVLGYELFQEPDGFDSIDLVFFDADDNGLSFVFEDENGLDVGGVDHYFSIDNNFSIKANL